jgi:hypothetical protein
LVFGVLVFNEILILPFFGLNQFTKKELIKKEVIDKAKAEAKALKEAEPL